MSKPQQDLKNKSSSIVSASVASSKPTQSPKESDHALTKEKGPDYTPPSSSR